MKELATLASVKDNFILESKQGEIKIEMRKRWEEINRERSEIFIVDVCECECGVQHTDEHRANQ